jgi:hypothetical protein
MDRDERRTEVEERGGRGPRGPKPTRDDEIGSRGKRDMVNPTDFWG